MFDAFGNWSNNKPLKKRHLKKIREQGIEIVKFDPFTFPYINHAAHRDHRKIARTSTPSFTFSANKVNKVLAMESFRKLKYSR